MDKEIFEKAFELCAQTYNETDVFDILAHKDDIAKQIAILNLENISSQHNAQILVSHLTNHDGPIREVTAIKIRELLLEKHLELLNTEDFYNDYINAICDVNPNICRMSVEFLPILKNQTRLFSLLLDKIENIFERIDAPDKEQKNFLTVRIFNVYWLLEAIGTILPIDMPSVASTRFIDILKKSADIKNYTIDEKIAKIIKKANSLKAHNEIINKLTFVDNFYVKRYFEDNQK